MLYFLFSILNYLIGSINFALVIGKLFYHKDIRNEGSGNLGATNAGRTLGKSAALLVALLDGLKGFILFLIESLFSYKIACLTIAFVAIGHCYPIFAQFKGGKAVATTYGVILAISLQSLKSFIFVFLIPLLTWLFIKKTTQYVSLGSIVSILLATISSLFVFREYYQVLAVFVCFIIVVIKHKDNIIRLLQGKENKANY